jgi:carbamoyltransferase
MYYIDHHQSHSAYAFLTSGYDHSDILAIDGRGWKFNCIFINRYGFITDFSKQIPIGGLWNRLAQDLGFRYLDAGKVMGLAGYGKYNYQAHAMIEAYVLNANHKLPDFADEVIKKVSREDIAHTLQQVTIDLIKKYIYPLKTCDNICLAGGVAYNGYMNEELTKHYDNVHVPPAVGDEGQALGTYMHADYVLNQNVHTPTVFAGPDQKVYETMMLDFKAVQYSNDDLNKEVATAISKGSIVGWYQGRSESGNRALGNRSILADPRNPSIKDIINKTIKKREDFRPFAPSVLEEYYKEYFDTNQPSPYMSRIMPVKSDKIPGVTHVDNTARIQTVNKEFNYKF